MGCGEWGPTKDWVDHARGPLHLKFANPINSFGGDSFIVNSFMSHHLLVLVEIILYQF